MQGRTFKVYSHVMFYAAPRYSRPHKRALAEARYSRAHWCEILRETNCTHLHSVRAISLCFTKRGYFLGYLLSKRALEGTNEMGIFKITIIHIL